MLSFGDDEHNVWHHHHRQESIKECFHSIHFFLKRFVDVKYETSLTWFSETIVETHIDILLKLPTIAEAPVGKQTAELELFELTEHSAETSPDHHSVSFPHVL